MWLVDLQLGSQGKAFEALSALHHHRRGRGCPGEAEGHAAKAGAGRVSLTYGRAASSHWKKVSSQFDRFFQHGQHTAPWYGDFRQTH